MTIFEIDLDNAEQLAEFAERVVAASEETRLDPRDQLEVVLNGGVRAVRVASLAIALTKAMREWAPADSPTTN